MPRKKTATVTGIKVIRSKTGSDFTFPTRVVDGKDKSVTAPWDRQAYLPPEFWDDPYVRDAVEKGLVEVSDAQRMPPGPDPMPDELDANAKGWLYNLIHGKYNEQYKSFLADWRGKFPVGSNRKARINELVNRIQPLCRHAVRLERKNQNRADLIADLETTIKWIEDEGWQIQVG